VRYHDGTPLLQYRDEAGFLDVGELVYCDEFIDELEATIEALPSLLCDYESLEPLIFGALQDL